MVGSRRDAERAVALLHQAHFQVDRAAAVKAATVTATPFEEDSNGTGCIQSIPIRAFSDRGNPDLRRTPNSLRRPAWPATFKEILSEFQP